MSENGVADFRIRVVSILNPMEFSRFSSTFPPFSSLPLRLSSSAVSPSFSTLPSRLFAFSCPLSFAPLRLCVSSFFSLLPLRFAPASTSVLPNLMAPKAENIPRKGDPKRSESFRGAK